MKIFGFLVWWLRAFANNRWIVYYIIFIQGCGFAVWQITHNLLIATFAEIAACAGVVLAKATIGLINLRWEQYIDQQEKEVKALIDDMSGY